MTFPDIVGEIESFFQNLYNEIIATIQALPGQIIAGINSVVSSLFAVGGQFFTSLGTLLYNNLQAFKDQILAGLANVPQAIGSLLGGIEAAIAPFVNTVISDISQFGTELYNRLAGLFGNIGSTLEAIFGPALAAIDNGINNTVATILAGVGNVGNTIRADLAAIPGYFSQAAQDLQGAFGQIGKALTNQFQPLFQYLSNISNGITADIDNIGALVQGASNTLQGFAQGLLGLPQELWKGASTVFSDIYNVALKPLLGPVFTDAQSFFGELTTQFAPHSPLDEDEAIAIASGLGSAGAILLTARWAVDTAAKVASAGQLKILGVEFDHLLEAYGVIQFTKQFNLAPIQTGVMPFVERGWKKIFRPEIAAGRDVLRASFVAGPDFANIIPAPQAVKDYLAREGFPDSDIDLMYTSQFQPLRIFQLARIAAAGIITPTDYTKKLMRLAIPPDDIQAAVAFAIQVPKLADAATLYQMGKLSDDQIQEIVTRQGMDAKYNDALQLLIRQKNIIPVFAKLVSIADTSYKADIIEDSDYLQLMKLANLDDNVAQANLQVAQLDRNLDLKNFQVTAITSAMQKGTLTLDQGRTELTTIGIGPDRIAVIIAKVQYLQKVNTPTGASVDVTKLSVSDIVKAVKKGNLAFEDGYNYILAKGYSPQDAQVLFGINGIAAA